jgi:hypothetical protein
MWIACDVCEGTGTLCPCLTVIACSSCPCLHGEMACQECNGDGLIEYEAIGQLEFFALWAPEIRQ